MDKTNVQRAGDKPERVKMMGLVVTLLRKESEKYNC